MALAARQLNRTATQNDLFSITGSWSTWDGVASVPLSVRPWIFWFVALLKCGYIRILAPRWAITKSHAQSCGRTTNSKSSTYRALAWLEANGYITKSKWRRGADIVGMDITIHADRFKFFMMDRRRSAEPSSVEIPYSEVCDNSPPVPSWDCDDNRSSNNKLHKDSSCVGNKRIFNKNNSKKNAKNHKFHPIVYSILKALERENADDKWRVVNLAKAWVSRQNRNVPLDLDYWEQRWGEFSPSTRDLTAQRELIPVLRNPPKPPPKEETVFDEQNQPISFSDFLKSMCNGKTPLKTNFEIPEKPKEEQKRIENTVVLPDLPESELEILLRAKNRLEWTRKNHFSD